MNEHRSVVRDKIMSCCAAYAIILLGTNAQPEERICWFQKKTRAGEECRGLMRRLDDATARFVGGNPKLLDLFSPLDESHPRG